MREPTNQVADAVVRAAPPAAVTFSDLVLGMPVEKWLTVTLIIYTVLQIVLLVRDRVVRRKRAEDKA
jgi:hypothetical protein